MNSKPLFIVLCGDGINCERETAMALEKADCKAKIVHINALLKDPSILRNAQGLALPGGFSFGDELGSGRILALKLIKGLGLELKNFVLSQKAIIGICNGFQALVKMGLLPDHNKERVLALVENSQGTFIDRWVDLNVYPGNVCKWTKLLKDTLSLPMRHGEGRIAFQQDKELEIYEELLKNGQIVFQYSKDVNGSAYQIAGLTDPTGMILGMMPHPEASVHFCTHPLHNTSTEYAEGYKIFKAMSEYLKQI